MARLHFIRSATALFWLALVLCAGAAQAQTGDEPEKIRWAADEILYDTDADVATARGNVEIVYEGNTLYADQVTYNRNTDEAVATGNIRLVDQSGNVATGTRLVLTGDLKTGTVEGMRILFRDGERLAALNARREDGRLNILDRAIYTACQVCDDDPDDKPVWQVKAMEVVHNQDKRTLVYKDAYLELLGVPIAYTPWLKHPDATVKRASGLLAPDFGQSSLLGVTLEVPYFWNIAPNMDMTITPLLTTEERAALFLEFRHQTTSGQYLLSGSGTYVSKRDDENQPIPGDEFRGHLFGEGQFKLGGGWRWGFDMEVVTDDTYLRRYDVSRADSLINHLYVEHFTERNYLHIGAYAFQGLREEDIAGQTPIAAPFVQYNFVGKPGWLGGRFEGDASALFLTRTDGSDTGRLSAEGRWRLPYTSPFGELYTLTMGVRADGYYLNDPALAPIASSASRLPDNDIEGRVIPYAALEWRLPFVRYAQVSRQIVEPMVMVVASPKDANNDLLPNEDSQSFDFDATNLFEINRFPGLDRWESGVRIAYGLRMRHYTDSGLRATLIVGQSYRFHRDPLLPADSGLQDRMSDIVVTASLSMPDTFDYVHRLRFDKDGFSVVRNEATLVFGPRDFRVLIGYNEARREGFDRSLNNVQEVRTGAQLRLSRYWRLDADFAYDFEADGGALTAGGGITYEDECLRFRLSARRDFTDDRDVPPSTSIGFQLVFKVLSAANSSKSRRHGDRYNPLEGPLPQQFEAFGNGY
ncbi:MAG: LPS-assembly protein LptD [Alphaproteobacteria bacterium]